MLKRLDLRGSTRDLAGSLPRPELTKEEPAEAVKAILADVRARGDAALRHYTEVFDRALVGDLRVPQAELESALEGLDGRLREALEVAREAITGYHSHQLVEEPPYHRDGVSVRSIRLPVARAGLYVPGGRARYPSSVLMTTLPAKVAGVDEVVLCVPPGPDGAVDHATLGAAALVGVDEVYRVGGAQAVGAMAYGTETIKPVDVVAGPGNVYVSLAMRQVAGQVGVPSCFAGPSEVVVIADDTTPPEWAAIDVVVQAEHGPDGLAWLVTWSEAAADAISREVERIVSTSPRKPEIESTLADGGYAVLVDGPESAMDVANAIAPEHLEIMCEDAADLVAKVRNAGAVFVGPMAPASLGDYVAGPNHVLPTNGSARYASALRVDDFCKHVHVVSADEAALRRLAPHVIALAEAEGLVSHAASVRLRVH